MLSIENSKQDTLFNAPKCTFEFGLLSTKSTSYLFHSNADIYLDKDCHQKQKGEFPIGTKVYIIDTLTSKNGKNTSRVYRCKLKTDAIPLTCYIPLKDLALAWAYTKNKTLLLVGFSDLKKSIEEFDVKLVKNETLLSKQNIQFYQTDFNNLNDFFYGINLKKVRTLKHSKISSFYNLHIYYPACGYIANNFYIFNQESKISISPSFPSMFEAGIYNYSGTLKSKNDQFYYTAIGEEILDSNIDSNFVKSNINEVTIKYNYSPHKGLVFLDTVSQKKYISLEKIE